MKRIEAHRVFFSRLVTSSVGISNPEHPVTVAFASTPREHFLGPGPWHIFTIAGYIETPTDDPTFLYHDVSIALSREKQLNNGQPAMHAACLASLKINPGDAIVHIGAGTGYYTAMLSKLTGPSGKVFAYEIDGNLAGRAIKNLENFSNVTVLVESGSEAALTKCDVIYINAGATDPVDSWLDALKPGGRLLFPLTPAEIVGQSVPGMMLRVCREENASFSARFVCAATFTPCIGARNSDTAARLTAAFARGNARDVRSLRRGNRPDESCWCEGNGWWLSTKPI
jgi:protein-L-isoaspartate(D-aspartate) O-methyltransferase